MTSVRPGPIPTVLCHCEEPAGRCGNPFPGSSFPIRSEIALRPRRAAFFAAKESGERNRQRGPVPRRSPLESLPDGQRGNLRGFPLWISSPGDGGEEKDGSCGLPRPVCELVSQWQGSLRFCVSSEETTDKLCLCVERSGVAILSCRPSSPSQRSGSLPEEAGALHYGRPRRPFIRRLTCPRCFRIGGMTYAGNFTW